MQFEVAVNCGILLLDCSRDCDNPPDRLLVEIDVNVRFLGTYFSYGIDSPIAHLTLFGLNVKILIRCARETTLVVRIFGVFAKEHDSL